MQGLRRLGIATQVAILVAFASACSDGVGGTQKNGPGFPAPNEPILENGPVYCDSTADCPVGHECKGGLCEPLANVDTTHCRADVDCALGKICDEAIGECVDPPEIVDATTDASTDHPPVALCDDGEARTCGISKVGVCRFGVESCTSGGNWAGVCQGSVNPGVESCNYQDDDCDGPVDEDFDLFTDVRNCGTCGNECSFPHAAAACVTGGCVMGACQAGWWDLDGDPSNGCEYSCAFIGAEVCDGADNDCDGGIDGVSRACYGGPDGTRDVGLCHGGAQSCAAGVWSACGGQVLPADESCNGSDDDCDGVADFLREPCYEGPGGTADVGSCQTGSRLCASGVWGACEEQTLPASESCNAADDDCDGAVDGLGDTCYTGPAGTPGVGVCRQGSTACSAGAWSACAGEVNPTAESCNALDDDCDGTVDQHQMACYTGPAGTSGVGECVGGLRTCAAGSWGSCAGEVVPAGESCNARDDDCDGVVDVIDATCYSGPAGTAGVGLCKSGTQRCAAGLWGSCQAEIVPAREACDGLDNDCNGTVDDGCDCIDGTARGCYTGGSGTAGRGVCHGGTQVCADGRWGSCAGQVVPSAETCDGADNDCDGVVDLITLACYDGGAGTRGVGMCQGGVSTCSAGVWGGCAGQVLPGAESCDGADNDCDGVVDEIPRTCYNGPPATAGVGPCARGSQVCSAGAWGACQGEVVPAAESCDGVDNDCDGVRDQIVQGCYTGAAGTSGVGECKGGQQLCSAGAWGSCAGQVVPAGESCNGRDDDCDGAADESLVVGCYDGPAGTSGVGECRAGTSTCGAGSWGACAGQVMPGAESCNGKDDDCNGGVDGVVQSCYSGPAATLGVGECKAGSQTCTTGVWGACGGEVTPAAESCNAKDDDCDGAADQISASCYSGPVATRNVGACREGTTLCSAGAWGACQGQIVPGSEVCDDVDNDCDGARDESLSMACYTGPAGTKDVGPCVGGTQTCSTGAWSSCVGQVVPAAETCDDRDNDCDGARDESLVQACYGGPAGTVNVGECKAGTTTCSAGLWGGCSGQVMPAGEVCEGVKDEDCDSTVDDGCACVNGAVRGCYTGPAGTAGVGLCQAGSQTCGGGAWGACVAQVVPAAESCDGADNDCDGVVDGIAQPCYDGPAGTSGVGLCKGGTSTCTAGAWGSCAGQVLPAAETCDNKDNDCDGAKDETLVQACYTGPAGTAGVGECSSGTSTCSAGTWGSCAGQVLPAGETCDDKDNDCDGARDEALVVSCYGGPAGTAGVGECRAGTSTCSAGAWASCTGEVRPGVESCDNKDNDCDGVRDESLVQGCYGGPAGTAGVGECRQGSQTCAAGAWGACGGEVRPAAETCDDKDNDCDGTRDESLVQGCYGGPAGTAGVGECRQGSQTCAAGAWGACGGEVRPAAETCDDKDNNCDGTRDESLVQACYGGPAGTSGVGECKAGTSTCSAGAWGSCAGQVLPAAEGCDNKDNDCDGTRDESLVQVCYGGPAGTAGVGECRSGSSTCSAGAWGSCAGEVRPAVETCDNRDNDCDGSLDETLVQACYSGPAGTAGVGECKSGSSSCAAGVWGACGGEVLPAAETCDNKDNDCDAGVDETLTQGCYTGAAGTSGVGECRGGTATCSAGTWGSCAGQVVPAAETCDNKDNDCDGARDETLVQACYTGAAGTSGVGECRAGTATCSAGAWGSCAGQVVPAVETCDAKDNDCDASVDETLVQACYTGPAGTSGVGECKAGTSTCSVGVWGSCAGQVVPGAETCDNKDNDCDGTRDETLTQGCYTGPAGTSGVGECRGGTATCSAGTWGSCAGQVVPAAESCDNKDNDCDASVDETLTQGCYTGPAGTSGVGECKGGTATCSAGAWGSCAGQVVPAAESCDNKDNDCDASVDETLAQACYTGPAGTSGVGECQAGTSTCSIGVWGSCAGQVVPAAETCNNKDDDCDATRDETLTQTCYTGPAGTSGVGECRAGTSTCSIGVWGSCTGQVVPAVETCNNKDDDCDATRDESLTQACYTGPAGTQGVGECVGGSQSCSAGTWGSCGGQVVPVVEICDGKNNDCDGSVDEGFDADADNYTTCGGDCADNDPTRHPGATEVCNSLDDDCDGSIDEGLSAPTANAGADQTVAPLATATLAGTFTGCLANGSGCTYQWTITNDPPGANPTLSGSTTRTATLSALDTAGDYTVCVVATNTSGCASAQDCVVVHVVPTEDIHVELFFPTDAVDVDLHYIAPGAGSVFPTTCSDADVAKDTFYCNKQPNWGGNPSWTANATTTDDPGLDQDDTVGPGTENLNQSNPFAGMYAVKVHYYCHCKIVRQGPNYVCAEKMGATTARVRVYAGGILRLETSKSISNGDGWHAADITVTSTSITVAGRNTVSDEGSICPD